MQHACIWDSTTTSVLKLKQHNTAKQTLNLYLHIRTSKNDFTQILSGYWHCRTNVKRATTTWFVPNLQKTDCQKADSKCSSTHISRGAVVHSQTNHAVPRTSMLDLIDFKTNCFYWIWLSQRPTHTDTHTVFLHTCLMALCPGLPVWAVTRKVNPVWILLKQETVSGSGICWAVCKSAPHSRQITTPAPHHSVFYRPDALPDAQPTASKHWIKYTEAISSNSTRKLLWFEITKCRLQF